MMVTSRGGMHPSTQQNRFMPAGAGVLAGGMSLFLVLAAVHAEDALYRCDDGSFTNRAEAGCASYQTQGSIAISPDGQPPPVIRERARSTTTIAAVLPPPAGKVRKNESTLCGLYEEWQTL